MSPLFASKQPDLVTLAVEGDEVRWATTKSGKIGRWGVEPMPPEIYADGVITAPSDLSQVLTTLFDREKLDRKHVVSSVSGLRAIPRMLVLPKLQASVLEETIQRQARNEMPVSLDDLYLSWQMMPAPGEMQRVYLLGVPRALIDSQVTAMQGAGIDPYVMDLKPLALVRAVGQAEAIIVNLENHSLDIILVSNRLPGIMRSFSLPRDEASKNIRIKRMTDELVQTVRFYNDSHPASPMSDQTSLFVTGKALGDSSTAEALRDALKRPIERAPAPLEAPGDLPIEAFTANLGLAIKKTA